MNESITANFDLQHQLSLKKYNKENDSYIYHAEFIDTHEKDDKHNPLWLIEPIADGVYMLTYEKLVRRQLVMYASLLDCLNYIHRECEKRLTAIRGRQKDQDQPCRLHLTVSSNPMRT